MRSPWRVATAPRTDHRGRTRFSQCLEVGGAWESSGELAELATRRIGLVQRTKSADPTGLALLGEQALGEARAVLVEGCDRGPGALTRERGASGR